MATVKDMVIWAKDRLVDDLRDAVEDFIAPPNYAVKPAKERRKFERAMTKMSFLLSLPGDYKSLALLRKAGYWNGDKDTYWEEHQPPTGYNGQ